jgi:CTP synthase
MLLEYGIQPDILVCRTEHHLTNDIRKKIALFCNVNINAVIESIDAPSIYDVPLLMLKEQLDKTVLTKLKLPHKNEPNLENWKEFLGRLKNPTADVRIALVGKYVELPDAYKSITEAFIHAGAKQECKVRIEYIPSEQLTPENAVEKLKGMHGVLVAPGFGERGFEGKIQAIRHVRENNIPFFGICLGMQCAVVEFGRNVLGFEGANSTEMNPETPYPVIGMMEDQKNITNKGGTMRLGAYPCDIKKGTKAAAIYGKNHISERHRHRYEFNNEYLKQYEAAGLTPSGINPDNGLVEIVELKNHPFFVGSQFHPELKSTVANPHPLFINFVAASLAYARKK